MIRSQMISFRPENAEERDLPKYISLIQEVFDAIKQLYYTEGVTNVNNVAASIRQIVLRNDCLELKDDLLDFFVMCEKSTIGNQSKKGKKQEKGCKKSIENKINMLKGFQNLRKAMNKMMLSRGFNQLKPQKQNQVRQSKVDIETFNIEVQQDIKLKTLYFFKWCKFYQYCKSAKKIRLKQIDDLRKSLTFNMYAVKFSYFHQWRKQTKNSSQHKIKFATIQFNARKRLFNYSVQGFYKLFGKFPFKLEIKTIEQKLVQKVQESIKFCGKQTFFKFLTLNKKIESSKKSQFFDIKKRNLKQKEVQQIRFRFIDYLRNQCCLEPAKTKTLSLNYENRRQQYALLCANKAFQCLKRQVEQIKGNIVKIQQFRKINSFLSKYIEFSQKKSYYSNIQILECLLKKNKMKKGLESMSLNLQITKSLTKKQSETYNQNLQAQKASEICFQFQNTDLFKYLKFKRLKLDLDQRMKSRKIQNILLRLKQNEKSVNLFRLKFSQLFLLRQNQVINALVKNHQSIRAIQHRNQSLNKIYQRNVLKQMFKNLKVYKFIRISHEEVLERIQQKIINRKQVLTAFQRIQTRKHKLETCELLLSKLQYLITKTVFQRCFYDHIQTLRKVQSKQKQKQLHMKSELFQLLKKNKQYNCLKSQEIQQNIIEKLKKGFFFKNLRSHFEHSMKLVNFSYYLQQKKQQEFMTALAKRKTQIASNFEKISKLQCYLSLRLFSRKIQKNILQTSQHEQKSLKIKQIRSCNSFKIFQKSINQIRSQNTQLHIKVAQLTKRKLNISLASFTHKMLEAKRHNVSLVQRKIQMIATSITVKPFMQKLKFQAKNNYLSRWVSWRKRMVVFQKLEQNATFVRKTRQLRSHLKMTKQYTALKHIKHQIEIESQYLSKKQQELRSFISGGRKLSTLKLRSKFQAIKQTEDSQSHLINSIKTKYFSKFMRNILILKYQKVKEYCAIRSYARKLQQKSINGLRIMLLRLRDKENRLKTQQEIIIKVDKALHHSRNSNKLSETIQRFNNMRKSTTAFVPR